MAAAPSISIDPELMPKREVVINCDMGEGFGLYKLGNDEALMEYITHANVACGYHASDPMIMAKTVQLAKKHSVLVGAHPSLPDMQGFGRREMKVTPDEVRAMTLYQVGALVAFLHSEGMELSHVKPHGALYGMLSRDEKLMEAFCEAVEVFGKNVAIFGLDGTWHQKICHRRNIRFFPEFYSDLQYDTNGNLIISRTHEAVDPKQVGQRVTRALEKGEVETVDGGVALLKADAVCVHSDTPGAVDVAVAVRDAVKQFNATLQ